MTEPTPEAYEAAAIELASQSYATKHGQLCPVWVHKARVAECDCWILVNARNDVRVSVKIVWPIAEATVRAKIAAEIRTAAFMRTGSSRQLLNAAARIAEGNGDKTTITSAGPSGG